MNNGYLVQDEGNYLITDPSGIGITYRVVAKTDGRIIAEVVSLPAAKEVIRTLSKMIAP